MNIKYSKRTTSRMLCGRERAQRAFAYIQCRQIVHTTETYTHTQRGSGGKYYFVVMSYVQYMHAYSIVYHIILYICPDIFCFTRSHDSTLARAFIYSAFTPNKQKEIQQNARVAFTTTLACIAYTTHKSSFIGNKYRHK